MSSEELHRANRVVDGYMYTERKGYYFVQGLVQLIISRFWMRGWIYRWHLGAWFTGRTSSLGRGANLRNPSHLLTLVFDHIYALRFRVWHTDVTSFFLSFSDI